VPADKVAALEYLGIRHVSFTGNGPGDDILTFRRRRE